MSLITAALGALGFTQSTNLVGSFLLTFGDSYSSTGYDPTSLLQPSALNAMGNPLYPGVTTSGGANWVDKLTVDHLPPGYSTYTYNYAYPGATVNHALYPAGSYSTSNDFVSEVTAFQTYGPKDFDAARVAALVYWGTNDVLIHSGQPNSADNSILKAAMNSYWAKMRQLYAESVRNFVVFTADPVERIPFATLAETNFPGYAARCKNNRQEWNRLLAQHLAKFRFHHPDAKVVTVDTVPIFNKILDNPLAYGAPNNYCTNSDGTSCLFWDTIHPGQAIQTALGDGAAAALQKLGFYPR